MKIHWAEFGAAGVLVGAACVAVFAEVQRSMRRAGQEQQTSTDRQMAAMTTTIKALQTRVAELSRLTAERAGEIAPIEDSAEASNVQANDPMKPEMLAIITAAATAFVGKTARIRSAKLVPVHDSVSAWSQQGRMIVQTSHNLRTRD